MERLEDRSLDDIRSFFRARRLSIQVRSDAGSWWAELFNEAGSTVAPDYGSGSSREAAIRAAARRWRIEQIGTDHRHRPGDPLP